MHGLHTAARVACLGALIAGAPLRAQPASAPDGVDSALPAWLAGHWAGSGFGGTVAETWTPPADGVMLGTFRLSVADQPHLYEFMILSVEDGQPTLRLKHFNADRTGWEERDEWVTFPFESMSDRAVAFDGLWYELVGEGELRVRVRVGNPDGTSEVAELRFRRQG